MELALNAAAKAALIWWLVPIAAVTGAIIYVIWVSKFQDKYENETNRSVDKFSSFQNTFRANPTGKLNETGKLNGTGKLDETGKLNGTGKLKKEDKRDQPDS
jgi:lipopolysaccharide export LptBFGC system permease protein LptF